MTACNSSSRASSTTLIWICGYLPSCACTHIHARDVGNGGNRYKISLLLLQTPECGWCLPEFPDSCDSEQNWDVESRRIKTVYQERMCAEAGQDWEATANVQSIETGMCESDRNTHTVETTRGGFHIFIHLNRQNDLWHLIWILHTGSAT